MQPFKSNRSRILKSSHPQIHMPTFRTIFPPFRSEISISHSDRLLCIGSCFAEQMGGRLERFKFPTLVNPFGIVFNPISIASSLESLLSGDLLQESDLFQNQGLWHSFGHHGSFSNPDISTALDAMNHSLLKARAFLENANRLVVTLGTANVFVLKKTGMTVANCHKVPTGEFDRRRVSVGDVVTALLPVFEKLKHELPSLEIITTVSPVRYLREGLMENQRSKATLVLALDEIVQQHSFVHYFPAYELLLDDLRDYRFYSDDLAHPNQLATDYIWQYFEHAYFEEKTQGICNRIERVLLAVAHRPFHPKSVGHQEFVKKQVDILEKLAAEFPDLDFEKELHELASV